MSLSPSKKEILQITKIENILNDFKYAINEIDFHKIEINNILLAVDEFLNLLKNKKVISLNKKSLKSLIETEQSINRNSELINKNKISKEENLNSLLEEIVYPTVRVQTKYSTSKIEKTSEDIIPPLVKKTIYTSEKTLIPLNNVLEIDEKYKKPVLIRKSSRIIVSNDEKDIINN